MVRFLFDLISLFKQIHYKIIKLVFLFNSLIIYVQLLIHSNFRAVLSTENFKNLVLCFMRQHYLSKYQADSRLGGKIYLFKLNYFLLISILGCYI